MKKRHPCTLNRMGAFSISVTCCSQQKFSVFHNAELLALPRCADDSYLFSQGYSIPEAVNTHMPL